jgi:hypothetical protein
VTDVAATPSLAGSAPAGKRRALIQPVATGLLVVVAFVGTYLLLLLAPTPRDLHVAVAAPGPAVAALHDALPPALRDGLAFDAVPDAAAAESSVRERAAGGAYLPGERTLLTASAAGLPAVQVLTGVFTRAAGGALTVRDVAPLPVADPRGLAGFYLVFGMVLAAFIFGQTNHLYSRRLPLRLRLAQTAVVAPVAGVLGALIAGPLVGATAAPFPVVAAVLALLVGAVALITQAATTALGDPGILVATLGLLTLGNATSGGAIPVPFLPGGLRQIAEYLPPGAAVRALADAGAFPDAPVWPPYAVLGGWIVAGLAVLLVVYRRLRSDRPLLRRSLI